jgi:hypothetical protein
MYAPAWPLIVMGIGFSLGGVVLVIRARSIARVVSGMVHSAPASLAALFLVRSRPDELAETERYLSGIYRVVGIVWIPLGLVILYTAFFGKPAAP